MINLTKKEEIKYDVILSLYDKLFYLLELMKKNNELSIPIQSMISYRSIIEKIIKLLDELNLKDTYSIYYIFSYLLWNGYLSKKHHFEYSMNGLENNFSFLAGDIMNGYGSCKNIATMLTDIFNAYGFNAYKMFGYMDVVKENKNYEYRPIIRRIFEEIEAEDCSMMEKVFQEFFLRRTGNHVVTMVKDRDKFYMYDPTNLTLYNYDSLLTYQSLGGRYEFTFKPLFTLITNDITKEELIQLINPYVQGEGVNNFKRLDVIRQNKQMLELCRQSLKLFQDFYIDCYQDISKVADNLSFDRRVVGTLDTNKTKRK